MGAFQSAAKSYGKPSLPSQFAQWLARKINPKIAKATNGGLIYWMIFKDERFFAGFEDEPSYPNIPGPESTLASTAVNVEPRARFDLIIHAKVFDSKQDAVRTAQSLKMPVQVWEVAATYKVQTLDSRQNEHGKQ